MAIALLANRGQRSEVDFISRQNQLHLFGRSTTNGDLFSRVIADGQTFIITDLTVAWDSAGADTAIDVRLFFNGVEIVRWRIAIDANTNGQTGNLSCKGFTFVGDGVAALAINLVNKVGSGTVSIVCNGYERNT